jgi:hypothetical protein
MQNTKVGLINQTPTKYQNSINNYKKNTKVGLMNQAPTMNQTLQ